MAPPRPVPSTLPRLGLALLSIALAFGCVGAEPDGEPLRGHLDGYERGQVRGWALGPSPDEPAEVIVEVDGVPVLSVTADRPRADLVEEGIHPTGRAGFVVTVPDLPPGAEVEAFRAHDGRPLANGPCVVQGELGVSSCNEGRPRARVGGVRDGRVFGWAQILGVEEAALVDIEVDGRWVATVAADRPRPDLRQKRLHPTGRAGFVADVGEVSPNARVEAVVDGFRFPLR